METFTEPSTTARTGSAGLDAFEYQCDPNLESWQHVWVFEHLTVLEFLRSAGGVKDPNRTVLWEDNPDGLAAMGEVKLDLGF